MIHSAGPLPKISCLLVTAAGRFEHFQRSVRCYSDQTYAHRELVVVNEGPVEYQRQISEHLQDRNDVKFVFLRGRYSLGALRNLSMALCNGDYFVQWDDDDFNAPDRLMVQFNHLSKHPSAKVCFFSDQLHYYFPTRQLYWENWSLYHSGGHTKFSLIPGTIMARKQDFDARYPSAGPWCSAGEDSVLAGQLCLQDEQVLLLAEKGCLQVYSYHGKNVWDIEHHLKISRERAMPAEFMLQRRDEICRTLDYLQFDGPVQVMGREGQAFVHRGR